MNLIFKTNLNGDELKPDFGCFSIIYIGIIIAAIMYPVLIMKEVTVIVKINSYGIYFVSFLLLFTIGVGFYSLGTSSFDFQYIKNTATETTRHLYLFGESPGVLAGVLSLGYFSHSFVLPVLKNNMHQENNKRDLFIGYILVMLTYLIVGIMGYIGFSGEYFKDSGEFKQNWFQFFPSDNPYITALRFVNVIQLLTILPVLFYIIRIQFFGTFFKKAYPGKMHVMIYSASLLLICLIVLFGFYDKVNNLMGFIGSSTSLALIYAIPLAVNVIYYRRKHPDNLDEMNRQSRASLIPDKDPEVVETEDMVQVDVDKKMRETIDYDQKDYYGISKKPYSKIKNILFYISQILLLLFGIFVFVLNFVQINFFSVEYSDPDENTITITP